MKNFRPNKWVIIWIIFLIFISAYISISFLYSSSEWISIWLQVGGIFLSLSAMIIIMLQNNETIQKSTEQQIQNQKELNLDNINAFGINTNKQIKELNINTDKQIRNIQEQTKEQITSFTQECNRIVLKLEDVTEELMKLCEINTKLFDLEHKFESEKLQLKNEEIALIKEMQIESIERNKPTLHLRFEIKTYMFFKHLYVFVYNQGNRARNTTINISFKDSTTNQSTKINSEVIKNIDGMSQHSFRLGRSNNFALYDKVFVQIDTRDVENRHYRGEQSYDLYLRTWYKTNTVEIKNILE